MRDKHRLVAVLGVSLGFASLALTVFAFIYVLAGNPSLRRQDHSGARRFSLHWSSREWGGPAVTEERTVEPFRGIDLRGSATVHVSAGSPPSLSVRARPGVVSEVVTEVKNGQLVIREKRPAWFAQSIDVYAVVEDVESLSVSGSGSGSLTAKVESHSIESRVTGSGKAFLNATGELDVTVTGSGNVRYKGDPKVSERITGSGSVSRSAR
jgi:hypothetical protein